MLDTERAAAVARAQARSVAQQARMLLEGLSVPKWVDGEERRFKPMWNSTTSELHEAVRQRWPDLTGEQQLAVVAAAEQLQRESVSATRHIDPETWMEKQQATTERNGGIPKRTAPVPAKKVAERSITPAVEQWTPATLRVFLLEQLRGNPEAKGPELWEAACKVKQPHVSKASFLAMYMPEARKALRSAVSSDAQVRGRGDAADVIRDDMAIQRSAATARGVRNPDAGSVDGCAEGDPRDLGVASPAFHSEDLDKSSVVEPPPVAEAQPAPPSSELRNPESAAAVVTSAGSGSIEISRTHDSFRATQRPDGMWDVEIRAEAVDHPVMDQLAAVMWGRIVGTRERTA